MSITLSDLREVPRFFDVVADRIWSAWWRRQGVESDYIVARLRENLAGTGIPIALVAHDGARFLGTASLIASDFDERPDYTPWVAAVWIEPDARGGGLGARLVEAAAGKAFAAGHAAVYLAAAPPRRAYYGRLGWTEIERGVGDLDLSVFRRLRG